MKETIFKNNYIHVLQQRSRKTTAIACHHKQEHPLTYRLIPWNNVNLPEYNGIQYFRCKYCLCVISLSVLDGVLHGRPPTLNHTPQNTSQSVLLLD